MMNTRKYKEVVVITAVRLIATPHKCLRIGKLEIWIIALLTTKTVVNSRESSPAICGEMTTSH
jgi:hypothetical protein